MVKALYFGSGDSLLLSKLQWWIVPRRLSLVSRVTVGRNKARRSVKRKGRSAGDLQQWLVCVLCFTCPKSSPVGALAASSVTRGRGCGHHRRSVNPVPALPLFSKTGCASTNIGTQSHIPRSLRVFCSPRFSARLGRRPRQLRPWSSACSFSGNSTSLRQGLGRPTACL